MERFLRTVDGRTGTEVASHVPGVTADDLSRWRRGEWKRLTEPKRLAIRKFLAAAAEHDHVQLGDLLHAPTVELDTGSETPVFDQLQRMAEETAAVYRRIAGVPRLHEGIRTSDMIAEELRKLGKMPEADEEAWAAFKRLAGYRDETKSG